MFIELTEEIDSTHSKKVSFQIRDIRRFFAYNNDKTCLVVGIELRYILESYEQVKQLLTKGQDHV